MRRGAGRRTTTERGYLAATGGRGVPARSTNTGVLRSCISPSTMTAWRGVALAPSRSTLSACIVHRVPQRQLVAFFSIGQAAVYYPTIQQLLRGASVPYRVCQPCHVCQQRYECDERVQQRFAVVQPVLQFGGVLCVQPQHVFAAQPVCPVQRAERGRRNSGSDSGIRTPDGV